MVVIIISFHHEYCQFPFYLIGDGDCDLISRENMTLLLKSMALKAVEGSVSITSDYDDRTENDIRSAIILGSFEESISNEMKTEAKRQYTFDTVARQQEMMKGKGSIIRLN